MVRLTNAARRLLQHRFYDEEDLLETARGAVDADAGDDLRHGLPKRPGDLDLPFWLRGRYGSAVGRAVHGVLQGVDLRPGAGLVVADYKTAGAADPAELDRRVAGYRNQGASYALAVARATGEEVATVVFVFLTPAGAVERPLPDLDGAVAEVRRRIEVGTETVLA